MHHVLVSGSLPFDGEAAGYEDMVHDAEVPDVHLGAVALASLEQLPPLARIAVQAPNTLFYYALVARDAAGNVSPMSNLVAVLVPQQLTSPTPSQQRLGCQS